MAAGGVVAALAFAGVATASPRAEAPGHAVSPRGASAIEQFAAERIGQGVLLRWIPASDGSAVGYNVFRRIGTQRVRVNDELIAATPALHGHAYRWLDRTSHHRAEYWLQVVRRDGTTAWRGDVVAQ